MAAPTPVSALVHSSNLVTAGVWLFIKFSLVGPLVSLFGGLTVLAGGLFAVFEKDMKKVVAFSTLSQIGLVGFFLGLGLVDRAFSHMLVHAFFKSLLFICVGFFIVTSAHNQSQTRIFKDYRLLVRSCFVISVLSMAGLPFFSGFFSKHRAFSLI
jgi:NADH-ubiquinone oxidoreductase chain 5